MRLCKAIPGANILAYVAPEYPVVEIFPRLLRNFFPEFYGVVANATASIYYIGLRNSIGGTSVHTCGAGSAIVPGRCVILQLKIDDEFRKEEETSHSTVQQQRILAGPSESCTRGPRPFHNRCRIHECPSVNVSDFFPQRFKQLLQAIAYDEMMILTIGILRNLKCTLMRKVG